MVTQKVWCPWTSKRCPRTFCPIPSPLTFRPHHADDPRQNDAAWVDFAGPSQGADGRCSRLDAGRGRVLESMSWSGCCSSACVQCLGLTGACAACSHYTATAWELSDLDHSHAATPQRVTRASCVRLLRSVLGAACRWFAWSSWSVCVYETGLLLLFAYIALLLLPLSFFLGVGAPSLSLAGFMFKAVRSGSWLSFSFSCDCSLLLRRLVCTGAVKRFSEPFCYVRYFFIFRKKVFCYRTLLVFFVIFVIWFRQTGIILKLLLYVISISIWNNVEKEKKHCY